MKSSYLRLAFALVALQMAASLQAAATRPNILLIYTDDHSYRTVSCYPEAHPWAKTPNIDRLAQRGVRFSHAYMGTWCMPARATMLTGLQTYGVQTMRETTPYPASTYDPAQCRFWPAEFRKQGYQTAQIGKWHTGTDTGFGRDWDYQIVWNRPKHTENQGNYYYDQMLSFNGGEAKMTPGYSTDNYTKWALEYIRGEHRDPNKPWYLWLCYGGVHSPFTPADRHRNAYAGAKVETPKDIYPPRPGKPGYMQEMNTWQPGKDGQPTLRSTFKRAATKQEDANDGKNPTLSEWVRQYNQAVLALDEGVGQLMTALESSGQLANTLVIFTADQGFAWGQHGFRHKIAPYDSNIRAPLIISMPGRVAEGKVVTAPVGGADVVPTIFQFAGLKLPWAMHGHDLTPVLRDPSAAWPHVTLLPFTGGSFGADTDKIPTGDKIYHEGVKVAWYVLLTQGQYKYIRTLIPGEIEQLYDLKADPEELTNLAYVSWHAATLKRFREATVQELRRTKAGFANAMPPVKGYLENSR